MESGDLTLAELPQADGRSKLRPILLIKQLPGFSDWLAVGVSSQLHQLIEDWDIPITRDALFFDQTGLRTDSVVRLSFLAVVPENIISGRIGAIPEEILDTAKNRLVRFLT